MKKFLVSIAFIAIASLSQAQVMYQLTAQWVENGNRLCKYSDGTVLNVGINLCALSITK